MKFGYSAMIAGVMLGSAAMYVGAQSAGGAFQVTRSVIASGGGVSTGGVYSVAGTIGQPAAGVALNGGPFTLGGGFWTAVQTPGGPLLRITRDVSGGAVVSWPAPSTGWVLQQTTTLSSQPVIGWTDVTLPAVIIANGQNTVTFTTANGIRYFRLRRP